MHRAQAGLVCTAVEREREMLMYYLLWYPVFRLELVYVPGEISSLRAE